MSRGRCPIAETTEEMERAVAVPPHERHGEEIEESAHVPLDAVVRASVLPRAMIHREFRDPVPAVVSEHGDVAMELAVEVEPLENLGTVCLETAVHVVQADPRDPARHGVEELRRNAACQGIAPLGLPARHEVVPLVEPGEEPWNLGRIVLEVAVDRHDDGPLGLPEPGVERRSLAEVPSEAHCANIVVRVVEASESRERPVCGAIVDEHRLPREPLAGERGRELVIEQRNASLLVVHGNDDRDHDARVPRPPGVA
jgi:hypothetical protein